MGFKQYPPAGDVSGPNSSTTGNLAVFGNTTGKLLSDGGSIADAVGANIGTAIAGLTPFDEAQSTDELAAYRPATQRVVWLVADAAGTNTKTITFGSISAVVGGGSLGAGADAPGFIAQIVSYFSDHLAEMGAESLVVHPTISNVAIITYPAGSAANAIVNTTDDPHLGIGPPVIRVAGAGTSAVNAEYAIDTSGLTNGRVRYFAPGSLDPDVDGIEYSNGEFDDEKWAIVTSSGTPGMAYKSLDASALSPELATGWTAQAPSGIAPAPTVRAVPEGADAIAGSLNPPQINGCLRYVAIAESQTSTVLSAGPLVVGRSYLISNYQAGDDFLNVGASDNATGISFVATGTTPTTWTNNSPLVDIAASAPVITPHGNNEIGDIVWSYLDVGKYAGTLAGAFPIHKTWMGTNGGTGEDSAFSCVTLARISDDVLWFRIAIEGAPQDGALADHPIEIRVYP